MSVHRIVPAVLLALMFVPQLAAASRPREIIVLRPTADSEVRKPFLVIVREDGTRTVYSRSAGAPEAVRVGETSRIDWSVDLEHGTYTAKRTPVSSDSPTAGSPRLRTSTLDVTPIVDENGDPTYTKGMRYVSIYSVDAAVPGINPEIASRTEAQAQYRICKDTGFAYPYGQMENFSGRCLANYLSATGTGWATVGCTQSWFGGNDGSVYGTYTTRPGTTPAANLGVIVDTYVDANGLHGSFSGVSSTGIWGGHQEYRLASATTITCPGQLAGGGGSGGGGDYPGGGSTGPGDGTTDPGDDGGTGGTDGGGWACVTIRDGLTYEALGVCCGTTKMILDCATGYAQ